MTLVTFLFLSILAFTVVVKLFQGSFSSFFSSLGGGTGGASVSATTSLPLSPFSCNLVGGKSASGPPFGYGRQARLPTAFDLAIRALDLPSSILDHILPHFLSLLSFLFALAFLCSALAQNTCSSQPSPFAVVSPLQFHLSHSGLPPSVIETALHTSLDRKLWTGYARLRLIQAPALPHDCPFTSRLSALPFYDLTISAL